MPNTNASNNLILIGMPGSGKSTIGKALAEQRALRLIDTDRLIEKSEHRSLQDIADNDGYLKLRRIEADTIRALNVKNCIIATGGSAIYSAASMKHLQSIGTVVYLSLPLDTIIKRIKNIDSRGLARPKGQSLESIYSERVPLYERYATVSIDCETLNINEICNTIAGHTGLCTDK